LKDFTTGTEVFPVTTMNTVPINLIQENKDSLLRNNAEIQDLKDPTTKVLTNKSKGISGFKTLTSEVLLNYAA
jgi:hypothetical protein